MNKPIYKDFESLFERFAIMTVDGQLPDQTVLQILKKVSEPEAFELLERFLKAEE